MPTSSSSWLLFLEGVVGAVHSVPPPLSQIALTKRPPCSSVEGVVQSSSFVAPGKPSQRLCAVRVHTIPSGPPCCWFFPLHSSVDLANRSDDAADLVQFNSFVAPVQPIQRCCAVLRADVLASPRPASNPCVIRF